MKRYFDIPVERLTLQIDVNEIGMKYTVDKIEKALKITGLREVDRKEYWNSKQNISENITVFHTRFYKNIDTDCFILFKGQRYEIIEPPDNIKYLNKELKIKTKLQVINNGD